MSLRTYILEDDAPKWYQRLTFEIYGGTFVLASIIFVAWHLIKNMMIRTAEQKKFSFIFFYVFIEFGFILRLLYCYPIGFMKPPPAIYGIYCFFPPVLTTTAILFFLISMLNSLDQVYQTTKMQKFGRLKSLVITYIGIFWIVCITFYSCMAYTDIVYGDPKNIWVKVFFYTSAGSNILACILLTIVTVMYVSELKKFTYTYNEKKTVVYAMLLGTILQLLLRVLQGVLNGTQVLIQWEKGGSENIYFQLYTCSYFFLSDVIPSIGYVLFMRKEDQSQVEIEEVEGDTTTGIAPTMSASSKNITGLLEKLYQKKEMMKNKLSSTARSEYEQESP